MSKRTKKESQDLWQESKGWTEGPRIIEASVEHRMETWKRELEKEQQIPEQLIMDYKIELEKKTEGRYGGWRRTCGGEMMGEESGGEMIKEQS